MAQNATVIAAHLDDKDLKNSIDKLVQYVDEGIKLYQHRVGACREMTFHDLRDVLQALYHILVHRATL